MDDKPSNYDIFNLQ